MQVSREKEPMFNNGKRYINTQNGYVTIDENVSRIKLNRREKKKVVWKTPKNVLIAILFIIMVIASVGSSDIKGVFNVCLAIVVASCMDLLFGIKQFHKFKFPDGAILTGMIISMVLSSAVPWYQTALTVAVAILSKHVLKVKKKPIFNPAAFGLMFALIVFSSGQSWWGGFSLLPAWCLVFLFIGGYVIIQKVNKFPQVFAFLGTYFSIFLILAVIGVGDVTDVLRNPFIDSVLFLAFFMLTDPPTSPAKNKDQIWFGVITAVISIIVYLIFGGLAFMLIGLLVANGWKAWKSTKGKQKQN